MIVVDQISIFVENRPGRLGRLCQVLSEVGVNIRAMMVPSGTDYGIVHAVVDRYDEAMEVLEQHKYRTYSSRVIDMELVDSPGAVGELAKLLSGADIDIKYAYAAVAAGRGRLILSVSDAERAVELLREEAGAAKA